MLGYYNISLRGTAHEKTELPCQDSNCVAKLDNGWIVAAIADGLGSAAHSEIGSGIAVKTVIDTVKEANLQAWNLDVIKEILESAYEAALQKIVTQSEEDGLPVNEYETTLTSLIYNGAEVAYLHVGDGGIISLNSEGKFFVLTTAQKGDAFNEVVPLRAGKSAWEFGHSEKQDICSILMMTDGIFDVACPPIIAKLDQPIRINYVRQFMDRNKLSVASDEDFKTVSGRLEKFYTGSGTRGITDDKTIVGIINTDKNPREQPPEYYEEPDLSKIIESQKKLLYKEEDMKAAAEEKQPDENIEKEIPVQKGKKQNDKRWGKKKKSNQPSTKTKRSWCKKHKASRKKENQQMLDSQTRANMLTNKI